MQTGVCPRQRQIRVQPGVQGGGKSLAAKAVAGLWGLPLLRLDFASLYNKFFGETERNLRKALAEHPNVLIRIPLIGGFNDAPADAERFAAFFEPLNTSRVRFEFLSYHEYGKDKWAQCGLPYRMERMKNAFVSDATVAQVKSVFEAAGLHVIHT